MIPTPLAQVALAATDTTIYTVPASQRLSAVSLIFCNTDTVARTITLHIRRVGVAAAVANRQLAAHSIAPNSTFDWTQSSAQSYAATSIISASASAAGVVSLTAGGILEAV